MTTNHWYVLYTKPKNEKKVADTLSKLGISVYCPVVKTVKVWSDRKKKVSEPLFKSYVFVNIPEHERDFVFDVNGVVRYLFWLGKPAIVRNEEIDAIKNFLCEQHKSESEISMEHLQEVEIIGGPLSGQKGKYLYNKGGQLVLQVETLGIVVKAQVHHSLVS